MTAPTAQDARRAQDAGLPDAAASAVVVRLGGGRCAIALDVVAEVGRLPRLTRVPGTPEWVAGVANVRGRVLPVVDPRPVLGVEVLALGTAARLLVLGLDGVPLGLLCEAVEGTVDLPESPAGPPGTLPPDAAELVCGQLADPRGPVALLDPAGLLALRRRLPRSRHTR